MFKIQIKFTANLALAFCLFITGISSAAQLVVESVLPTYRELKGDWPRGEADVVEFFSYNCTFCYQAQSAVEEFLRQKPSTLSFQRYAVNSAQSGWSMSATAFRAAYLAGVEDRIGPKLFDRMQGETGDFEDFASVRSFFDEQGVGTLANQYVESSDSTELRKHIFQLSKAIQLEKTPTFVVGGRYIAYWGSDQTPENFAKLILTLYQRSRAEPHSSCAVDVLDDETKSAKSNVVGTCK